MNSLVIFQAMMNDLLRNFINTSNIVFFIDDILVVTDMKERHNKLLEEILNRMERKSIYKT